jgi:hypothetical protein
MQQQSWPDGPHTGRRLRVGGDAAGQPSAEKICAPGWQGVFINGEDPLGGVGSATIFTND